MPKYTVVIEEHIRECREYEVEADTPKDAAAQARNLWVVCGYGPPAGAQVDVEERVYEVLGGSEVMTFDEDEMVETDA